MLTLGEESFAYTLPETSAAILSEHDRCRFLFKLSLLFRSGVPIVESLEAAARDEAKPVSDWIQSVTALVGQGHRISEAIKAKGGGFRGPDIALVRLGEETGRLAMVLERMAESGRRNLDRLAELKAKLTYPLVQLAVLGLLCVLLGAFFGPHLASMVEGLGGTQPALTRWVTFMMSPSVFGTLVAVLTLLTLTAALTWSTPAGRQFRSLLVDSIPLLSALQRELVTVVFCRNLALLLDCGFDWQRSLQLCQTGSETFDNETDLFRTNLSETDLPTAVEQCANFSSLLQSLLLIGYESQRIPEFLALYANTLEDSIRRRVELLLALLEPALLMFMGCLVGIVVVASFLPVMSLVEQL